MQDCDVILHHMTSPSHFQTAKEAVFDRPYILQLFQYPCSGTPKKSRLKFNKTSWTSDNVFVVIFSIIKTRVLYRSQGQVSTTFKADSRRNLVSALAKITPSPDWNIGVDRINLCDGNCTWRKQIIKDLYPWDAGNDNKHFNHSFHLLMFVVFDWPRKGEGND